MTMRTRALHTTPRALGLSQRRLSPIIIDTLHRLGAGFLPSAEQAGNALREILAQRDAKHRDILLGSLVTGVMALGGREDHIVELLLAAFSLDQHDPTTPITVALGPSKRLVGVTESGALEHLSLDIATPSAIVAASLGVHVARCSGSQLSVALMEELGAHVDMPPRDAVATLERVGFVFFPQERVVPRLSAVLADRFHTPHALSFALSGLVLPIRPHKLVYGLSHPDASLSLSVLARFGVLNASVVTTMSDDGVIAYGGVSLHGETRISSMTSGVVNEVSRLRASDVFELPPCTLEDLSLALEPPTPTTDPTRARCILRALRGEGSPALVDLISVNAATILHAGGVAADLREGFELARSAIARDLPLLKLQEIVTTSGGVMRPKRHTVDRPRVFAVPP